MGKPGRRLAAKSFQDCAKESKLPESSILYKCNGWKSGADPSKNCIDAINLSGPMGQGEKWIPQLKKCMVPEIILPPKSFKDCAKDAKLPESSILYKCNDWKNGEYPSKNCISAINISDPMHQREKWMPQLKKCMKVPDF